MLTQANVDACLTDLTTALGVTSEMVPFTGSPVIRRGMVIGDFTLAASAGLGPKTVTPWSVPYNDAGGRRVVTGSGGTWVVTGGVPVGGEVITGFVLTDMAGAVVEDAQMIDPPIAINAVGDGFVADYTIAYGS